jgi:hypothetical protein
MAIAKWKSKEYGNRFLVMFTNFSSSLGGFEQNRRVMYLSTQNWIKKDKAPNK